MMESSYLRGLLVRACRRRAAGRSSCHGELVTQAYRCRSGRSCCCRRQVAAVGDEDIEGNLVVLDAAHVGNRSSPASLLASSFRFSISAESST